jgi:hypothetical protein
MNMAPILVMSTLLAGCTFNENKGTVEGYQSCLEWANRRFKEFSISREVCINKHKIKLADILSGEVEYKRCYFCVTGTPNSFAGSVTNNAADQIVTNFALYIRIDGKVEKKYFSNVWVEPKKMMNFSISHENLEHRVYDKSLWKYDWFISDIYGLRTGSAIVNNANETDQRSPEQRLSSREPHAMPVLSNY